MNLMQHGYHDNRDNVFHYRDIGILIIAQLYSDLSKIYSILSLLWQENICGIEAKVEIKML